jgi:hypothetical protein
MEYYFVTVVSLVVDSGVVGGSLNQREINVDVKN